MYIYHIFTHNSNFQNPHFSMWKENLHKIIEIFNPLNVLEKYIWHSNFMKCDIGSAKCWPKNEKLIFKSDVCDDVYLILKDSILSLLSVSCCPHFLPKPAEGADFSGVLRPVKKVCWSLRGAFQLFVQMMHIGVLYENECFHIS